jgi:EpsI family protein
MPVQLAGWAGIDQQVNSETLDVLGAGDVLARLYTQAGQPEPIGLFIGYFPTQRTGQTIHSPKNCLPGSGWVFESSNSVDLIDVSGKSHRVGEYIITNGTVKQFVIYWYQAHGRSIADEYMAKFYMILDAIRTNRTDGALVRVITPISSGEDISTAKNRAEKFTAQLAPLLPRFIPD